jgi:hypothetical protein
MPAASRAGQVAVPELGLETAPCGAFVRGAARRTVPGGRQRLAAEVALRVAGEQPVEVLGDVAGRRSERGDRVVELVGDPGGELAERGEPCLLDQLEAGLLELVQRVGQPLPFGVELAVELDFSTWSCSERRSRRASARIDTAAMAAPDLRFGAQRPVELLEREVDDLDLGGGPGGEERPPLLGEGEQTDHRPGRAVVQPEVADAGRPVERDAPAQHDQDRVDATVLVGEAGAGRQPEPRPGAEDPLDGRQQPCGDLVGPSSGRAAAR